MSTSRLGLHALALASAAALALSACGGGGASNGAGSSGGGTPQKGGTLRFLTSSEKLQHLDPQVVYTGEDLAFASAFWSRSLTAYQNDPDDAKGQELVPDLATDTGQVSEDGKTWKFTVRDGVKWEDGNPVTCEDVKYGISRTFATDIIQGGPFYAVSTLDIPTDKDGNSVYKGPYTTKDNDVAAYDKAVSCDGATITFKLNRPAGDWNYTVTLGMGPVPKAKDTGAKYDLKPLSNGPYKIKESSPNRQLVLVRNDQWDPKTDPYRKAYPDQVVVKYSVQTQEIDQRMIADSGDDQQAVSRDALDTSVLASVFSNPDTEQRRVNVLDPYSNYLSIRVDKIKNLKIRQAIAVALDRGQIKTVYGGDFAGDLADGVVKPNLPKDYAPSGMWSGLLGKDIPDSGDPAYAKQLIQESGQPAPSITYQYRVGIPAAAKAAGVFKESLEKAGFKVKLAPLPRGDFYTIIFDPKKEAEVAALGWGPDWPNAVTILPELFGSNGGWNLSHVSDKAYDAALARAKVELDRTKQAQMWKDLNKEAMQNVYVIPTLFTKQQRLAGSKVHASSGKNGQVYMWSAYGSWPYKDLWVEQ